MNVSLQKTIDMMKKQTTFLKWMTKLVVKPWVAKIVFVSVIGNLFLKAQENKHMYILYSHSEVQYYTLFINICKKANNARVTTMKF